MMHKPRIPDLQDSLSEGDCEQQPPVQDHCSTIVYLLFISLYFKNQGPKLNSKIVVFWWSSTLRVGFSSKIKTLKCWYLSLCISSYHDSEGLGLVRLPPHNQTSEFLRSLRHQHVDRFDIWLTGSRYLYKVSLEVTWDTSRHLQWLWIPACGQKSIKPLVSAANVNYFNLHIRGTQFFSFLLFMSPCIHC